ncbi:MAG: ABC transporter ATP-binding protein [Hyphomicrobiaceae bacterium]
MTAAIPARPLLEVDNLSVEFTTRRGVIRVLDHVSFQLTPGATLGIVGESGCGKSMTALAIMRLVPPPHGRIAGGAVRLEGEDVVQASDVRLRQIRGKEISMIFQEPMTSLNPVFTVGDQIAEAVMLHEGLSRKDAHDRATEMLKAVHVPAPERRVNEYPHQLSGGMRQRAMIAMALACRPKVLIADEPTTALDVTVQAQVFDLLAELQETTGTAIILITHDMGAIAEMCDRVVVMYAGRRIEEGPVETILGAPSHPYTRGLLACRPELVIGRVGANRRLEEIPGVVPPLDRIGAGCGFADRCKHAHDRCATRPPIRAVGNDHAVACWLSDTAGHLPEARA